MIARQTKAKRLIATLQGAGIHDERVLAAIESIPRDLFVTPEMKDDAWEDMALPIGQGQTISQPYIVAIMTQSLALTPQDKVLEIGTGSGYQASVLSKIARRVYSIERHKPLLGAAEKMFQTLGLRNVTAICADGMRGWPTINGMSQAPFDKIIVTAAARERPPSQLIDQLKPGGIMVCPVGEQGHQVLNRYKKESEDTYTISKICDVRFVPLLPDVAREKKGEAA